MGSPKGKNHAVHNICRLLTYSMSTVSILAFLSEIDAGEGDGAGKTEAGNGAGFENASGEIGESDPNRAPSATIVPVGRGPSQAVDFFSARGAPSILEVGCCSGELCCFEVYLVYINASIFMTNSASSLPLSLIGYSVRGSARFKTYFLPTVFPGGCCLFFAAFLIRFPP